MEQSEKDGIKGHPLTEIVEAIAALPPDWHRAGSMSPRVLHLMADLFASMGPLNFSVETGSGKTTLLFSHASSKHLTFALDAGNGSISQVKKSSLFKAENVEFVEGPSQINLPARNFDQPIDVALIDGPHGYPFPELEYYHLYPHIREGGFLLLDDTQIPTIASMFKILKADKMWDLKACVDHLAVFQRTAHAGVGPTDDGWWLQGYNEAHLKDIRSRSPIKAPTLARKAKSTAGRMLPKRVKLAIKALVNGE